MRSVLEMSFLIVSEYVFQVGGTDIAGTCTGEALQNQVDTGCVLWGL